MAKHRTEIIADTIRVTIVPFDGKEIVYELFIGDYGLKLSTVADDGYVDIFEQGYEEHPDNQ
jgi:hypothetical protein